MKRGWQKKIALFIALLFLAGGLLPSMTVHAYTTTAKSDEVKDMELVAQSGGRSLYLDRKSALLCVVDDGSGIAVMTKIMDGDSGNATIKENQKSDFVVTYYKDERAGGTSTQVNYTMAIEKEQVEYVPIENGIEITYDMKEDKLSMDVVPKYISEDRMYDLVLQYLTSEERKWLNDYYRLYDGKYTRTKDGAGGTQSNIRRLYNMFYETGQYTDEDLEADNADWGYESTWDNLEIKVALQYCLENGDLVVRLPMEKLYVNDEAVRINTITLLPYFMSATADEKGYYIIPDGAGAVINFNNSLVYANNYSGRVYGKDLLIDVKTMPNVDYYPTMPVIGAVYEDYAILGIVENGQSMSEINARIAGKMDNYNTAYFTFYIQEMENVATVDSSSVRVNKFTGDVFSGDIVLRYKFFTDPEDLSYVGMAHAYQDYLVGQGILERSSSADPTALYLEIFGASLEAKTLLGFPYNGVRSLTSYTEAQKILEDMSSRGVGSANIQMNGWLDGGERHEKLTKVALEGAQGSKKQFNSLVQTAQSLGYGFYPDVALQEINNSFDFMQGGSAKSYAKKYGTRYLSDQYAVLTEQRMVGITEKQNLRWSPYLVSPSYLETYVSKALKGINKLSVPGITVTDLGTRLIADYNERKSVSRESASKIVGDTVDTLSEGIDVVMKSPYQYAWKGVTKMSDLPTRSNQFTVFNYDIPFLQLVLDGCVSYSTEPLNYQTQKDMEELLMKCIELRSNPKFYVMNASMDDLHYMQYTNYLSINYNTWADRIAALYQEYADFASQVSGSRISSHETIVENVVKVGYENGVTVYLNYTDSDVTVDGHELAAESYLIVK